VIPSRAALAGGVALVILDVKVAPAGGCMDKTDSVKGELIGLWYSGKAHRHSGNIQAVTRPGGFPPVGIARRARTGPRHHRRPRPRAAHP
jgi:hypothetical protein